MSRRWGVTLVGLGATRKDCAQIFEMPLPPSLSGDAIHRWMQVTLTWFSPVEPSRARYRLAALEAIAADADDLADYEQDEGWNLSMKSDLLAKSLLQKGTVWSRRLVHKLVRAPEFEEGAVIPIRVQCKDASGGGLDQDLDIHFAIAVTLQVAATAAYNVHEEVREQLQIRLSGAETP